MHVSAWLLNYAMDSLATTVLLDKTQQQNHVQKEREKTSKKDNPTTIRVNHDKFMFNLARTRKWTRATTRTTATQTILFRLNLLFVCSVEILEWIKQAETFLYTFY